MIQDLGLLVKVLGQFCKIQPVSDLIQEKSNSNFDVKCAPIHFNDNSHNSQSDRWIGLKFHKESFDMLSYLGLKFQIN
jgi:hypothetical protein